MADECCSTNKIHPESVCLAKENMPSDDVLRDMTELFKVLSDETRMKIISALEHCELCVCDLANLINASQSAVSHQLRILRQARLVKYRKDGKNSFYRLDDEHIEAIAKCAQSHVQETYHKE